MSIDKTDLEDETTEDDFVMDMIKDWLEDPQPKPKKIRVRVPSVDFWSSPWGILISNPVVENPKSKEGKSFRRRFRVPFPLFKEILLPLCIQHQIFNSTRRSRIPVEAKILSSLRVLGRDSCADDIAELL